MMQLILTTAPAAYSYHPVVELDLADIPENSWFSMSWPTAEQIANLEAFKPVMDVFLWGSDAHPIRTEGRTKSYRVFVVEADWPDRLAYLVQYQVERIASGLYPSWVDAATQETSHPTEAEAGLYQPDSLGNESETQ